MKRRSALQLHKPLRAVLARPISTLYRPRAIPRPIGRRNGPRAAGGSIPQDAAALRAYALPQTRERVEAQRRCALPWIEGPIQRPSDTRCHLCIIIQGLAFGEER